MQNGGLPSQNERISLPIFVLARNIRSIYVIHYYACVASGLCRVGVTDGGLDGGYGLRSGSELRSTWKACTTPGT